LVDNIHHLGRFVGGWLANLTFLAAFSTGRLTDSMSTKSANRTTLPITKQKIVQIRTNHIGDGCVMLKIRYATKT